MRCARIPSVVAVVATMVLASGAGSVHATDAAPSAVAPAAAPTASPAGAAPTANPTAEAPNAIRSGAPPIASPFGPGYDPTRPPPVEPKETGPGIVSATVVAAGPAEVEELRDARRSGETPFFAVVLDVQIAAGSTTPVLGAASVVAEPQSGSAIPLFVACAPTMDDPSTVFHGAGARLAAWNVAIGGRTWFCGGRSARLAIHVGEGGFRLTAKPDSTWNGPLVLLFEAQAESPLRVALPGIKVELPLPAKSDDRAN